MRLRTYWILMLSLLMASCVTSKKVNLMQEPGKNGIPSYADTLSYADYEIRIGDRLYVYVYSVDERISNMFNPSRNSSTIRQQIRNNMSTGGSYDLYTYLVLDDGTIDFPVLGVLNVVGLTKDELEDLICKKLKGYIEEEPIVTVRMVNYKISVLGEVARPGVFTISNEKVSIFEALALAGDLTIWGMRDNVKVIRENADGYRDIIVLNLNNADIANSPYYYLQQNDILYVTPNKTKAKNSGVGQSTSLWFSGVSILVSIVNILVTFFVLKK